MKLPLMVIALMLFSVIALNFLSTNVYAQQLVIDHGAPYDAAQWGQSGDEASAYANVNTGYVQTHVARNSYAHALVMGETVYSGSNLNKIAIYITIKNSQLSKDGYGLSSVKLWAWIYDQTDNKQIWAGFQDWVAADATGKTLYWTNQAVNIYNGHKYSFWAGIQARSWTWWIFQGWANADGTIFKIYACQWP